MCPVALIPVTDRIPLVKSMKASVRMHRAVTDAHVRQNDSMKGPELTMNDIHDVNMNMDKLCMFTIIQAKHCSSSSKSTQKLSNDIEGELPDLQFAQNHHGQGHSRVHMAPWDGEQSAE